MSTANTINVYRGRRLIAEGATARVDGVPLGDCAEVFDVYSLVQALGVSAAAMGNLTREFPLNIHRQHGSTAQALRHGLLVPQLAAVVDDFAIWFNDGTDIHKFTSTAAWWKIVTPDKIEGAGTTVTYRITAPPFVYTINSDPTPITYSDAIV